MWWRSYCSRDLLTILLLGFMSGLPLALTASTLGTWLFESKVDKTSIGLFAAVATPYALKFLWSPVVDSVSLPLLSRLFGRRRGWLLATQLLLMVSIILLGSFEPGIMPFYTALAALLVAFSSASQDIVIDAYRVESLTPQQQGDGAAMAQLGYRLGMLVSGAGALYFAAVFDWQSSYMIMAWLVGIGILITLLIREPSSPLPQSHNRRSAAQWIKESVIAPFADFMKREHWLHILVFIMVYRLADAFIGIMTNPFFLDIGFTKQQIATIVKGYGIIATLVGTFFGGWLVGRYGAMRILFIGGLLHGITNLLFVVQAWAGANVPLLAASIAVENLTGGISAAAFVAYLSSLCNLHYTATQYALLSSLAALGRTWLSTPAGWVADKVGWEWFFGLSALLALPGLAVLLVLNKRLSKATSLPAAAT